MQQVPSGKQYQLWAIVDGKPVDAGLITDCIGLCKMKRIDRAQAFAITLEKAGGSPTPTLTEMYVFGKIWLLVSSQKLPALETPLLFTFARNENKSNSISPCGYLVYYS